MDVSFKAVVFDDQFRVLLGRNPRSEWELLGGRADPEDLTPEDTVRREVREEAGLDLVLGALVDIWYYDVPDAGRVAVASYLARPVRGSMTTLSREHDELAYFAVGQIGALTLPEGYRKTILSAYRLVRSQT